MNKKEIEEQIKRCSEISERFGENSDDFCGYHCVAVAGGGSPKWSGCPYTRKTN